MNRLQLKMQDMHAEIRYIDGKSNAVADFLSRYQGFTGQFSKEEEHNVALISHRRGSLASIDASQSRVRMLQRQDLTLRTIMADAREATTGSTLEQPIMHKSRFTRFPVTIIDGVLYCATSKRMGIPTSKTLRIAAPSAMHEEILNEAHNSNVAGHSGVFKTAERIKETFWWPNMDADVSDHVAKCDTCQITTDKGRPPPPPLQTMSEVTGPNQRIHIDLFGPLKTSAAGNNYVIVITDAFSKFTRLHSLPSKDAAVVATAILKDIYVFGCPKRIVTDQGNEFCNDLQTRIWKGLDIEHGVTTPYHPQCNGQAEAFNKTLKHYLATAIVDADRSTLDWELYVAPLMFSYNTAVHSSTKVAPFAVQLGYNPRIPLWQGVHYPGDESVKNFTFADYLAKLRHAQHLARSLTHHNAQHAQQQQQDKADKQRCPQFPQFQPGDLVWVRIMHRNVLNANQKLGPVWERGSIISRKSDTTYVVERQERSRKKRATLNVAMLKPRTTDATPAPEADGGEQTEDEPPAESKTPDPSPTYSQHIAQEQQPAEREPTPPPPTTQTHEPPSPTTRTFKPPPTPQASGTRRQSYSTPAMPPPAHSTPFSRETDGTTRPADFLRRLRFGREEQEQQARGDETEDGQQLRPAEQPQQGPGETDATAPGGGRPRREVTAPKRYNQEEFVLDGLTAAGHQTWDEVRSTETGTSTNGSEVGRQENTANAVSMWPNAHFMNEQRGHISPAERRPPPSTLQRPAKLTLRPPPPSLVQRPYLPPSFLLPPPKLTVTLPPPGEISSLPPTGETGASNGVQVQRAGLPQQIWRQDKQDYRLQFLAAKEFTPEHILGIKGGRRQPTHSL